MVINKKKHLTKKQLKSIGYDSQSQIPSQIWHSLINNLFKPFLSNKKNNFDNQTFKQFIQMTKYGPNQQSTGRYRLYDIETIYISVIQQKNVLANNKQNKMTKKQSIKLKKQAKQFIKQQNQSKFKDSIQFIIEILSTFLQIKVQYHDFNLYIDSKSHHIIDGNDKIEFEIKKNRQNSFEVFSLFDLGLEYKQKLSKPPKNKQNIVLFLIGSNLIQGQDEIQVDGRAIGNGVAFVSFQKDDFSLKSLAQLQKYDHPCYTLPVLIHECMHTLGFDHCSGWECLMNSVTNEQYWLCPCCLRKLQSEMKEKLSITKWYDLILGKLQQVRCKAIEQYGEDCQLRLIEKLVKKQRNYMSMLEKGERIIQFLKNNH